MPDLKLLEKTTIQVRRDILRMVHKVNSGHPGGSLGCAEFFVALYFEIMEQDTDFDMDGCFDSTEDNDDDNDNVTSEVIIMDGFSERTIINYDEQNRPISKKIYKHNPLANIT